MQVKITFFLLCNLMIALIGEGTDFKPLIYENHLKFNTDDLCTGTYLLSYTPFANLPK